MTSVVDIFRSLLPPRAKSSPSGWTSFNAPCCEHRGHHKDTRKRGGVLFSDGIVYNCFNCKFSTGWKPGSPISPKFKSLCQWLGANDDAIKEMVFEALKSESGDPVDEIYEPTLDFTNKELPEGSMSLSEWINSEYWNDIQSELEPVISYAVSRGYDPFDGNFYWSPSPGYTDRIIIPFLWGGRIVGNTARKITNGKPKYLSDQHPHFVFNFDRQVKERKYIIVTEGPFDALAIDGVALLTNDISDQQARIINSADKEVIVIPDQDRAGLNLIDRAIHYRWKVAFPNWDLGVKDCADAVHKYGKLFVITDIIKTSEDNHIKIEMAKRAMIQKLGEKHD